MPPNRKLAVLLMLGGTLAPAAQPPSNIVSLNVQQAALRQQQSSLQQQRDSVIRQVVHQPQKAEPSAFIEPLIPPQQIANCPPLPPAEIDSLTKQAAEEQSLKPELLRAVMRQESGFKPCAVSIKGAQGLMQLMPETADRLHISDPFDPMQNVKAGASFLRTLLNRYNGDLKLALAAYNAGANQVDSSGGVPAFAETQNYVASILAALGQSASSVTTAPGDPPNE